MKPESINRACAELCGWKWAQADKRPGYPHYPRWMPPKGWHQSDHDARESVMPHPPSFTTSLDAAQMAFKALAVEQQDAADFTLWRISRGPMFFTGCTPLQWCEAILKAAGKWEETTSCASNQ